MVVKLKRVSIRAFRIQLVPLTARHTAQICNTTKSLKFCNQTADTGRGTAGSVGPGTGLGDGSGPGAGRYGSSGPLGGISGCGGWGTGFPGSGGSAGVR